MCQTAEDGVRVGLDGAADLKASKRSSVTSLAWDDSDFLQYRESGAESRASTITDSDREATPTGDWADPPTGESVRMQVLQGVHQYLALLHTACTPVPMTSFEGSRADFILRETLKEIC